jgi:hypothetical protein
LSQIFFLRRAVVFLGTAAKQPQSSDWTSSMCTHQSHFASTLCAMPPFSSFSTFFAGALLLALIPSAVMSQIPPMHCNSEFCTGSQLQEWHVVPGVAKVAVLFGSSPVFQYAAEKIAIQSFIWLWRTDLYTHLTWNEASAIVSTPPGVSPFNCEKCSNGTISNEFDVQTRRFVFYCSSTRFSFSSFILMWILLL